MTTKQITLSLLLFSALASNNAKAMEGKAKKIVPFIDEVDLLNLSRRYVGNTKPLAIQKIAATMGYIDDHNYIKHEPPYVVIDEKKEYPYPCIGNSDDYRYKYNPECYEMEFMCALRLNLAEDKKHGQSEDFLNNHKTSLLISMEEHKQEIIQLRDEIRNKTGYYPQTTLLLEWKK